MRLTDISLLTVFMKETNGTHLRTSQTVDRAFEVGRDADHLLGGLSMGGQEFSRDSA